MSGWDRADWFIVRPIPPRDMPTTPITITCIDCGPVRVEHPADARYIRGIVQALAVGHAPLGGISCPMCRGEVRARDVRMDVEPWLAAGGAR